MNRKHLSLLALILALVLACAPLSALAELFLRRPHAEKPLHYLRRSDLYR